MQALAVFPDRREIAIIEQDEPRTLGPSTASREDCLRSLDSVVTQMQCANAALPKVWDAIDAQNDDAERARHDQDCHRQLDAATR